MARKLPEVSQVIQIVPSNMDIEPDRANNVSIRQNLTHQLAEMARKLTDNGDLVLKFYLGVMSSEENKMSDRLIAADRLMERGFGKPIDNVEISGPNGGPIQTENYTILSQLSLEELKALAGSRLNRDLEPKTEDPPPTPGASIQD